MQTATQQCNPIQPLSPGLLNDIELQRSMPPAELTVGRLSLFAIMQQVQLALKHPANDSDQARIAFEAVQLIANRYFPDSTPLGRMFQDGFKDNVEIALVQSNNLATSEPWILTHTGRQFNVFEPMPQEIMIEDIAHALANQCRFSGQCRQFYSVAQHSVMVAALCPAEHGLAGLLHDAAEAYLADVARPVKRHPRMEFYRQTELKLSANIFHRFGLDFPEPECVRLADRKLLVTEARDLFPSLPDDWKYCVENGYEAMTGVIDPWPPAKAEEIFLEEFKNYYQQPSH